MSSDAPVKSMTGFGRAAGESGGVSIDVEIRSLNHRFTDITLKLPKQYTPFELPLRALAAQSIRRGKVEISVTRKRIQDAAGPDTITFNRSLFDAYFKIYRERLAELGSAVNPQMFENLLGDILGRPGVIETTSEQLTDADAEYALLKDVLERALLELLEMRTGEGRAISADMIARVEVLESIREEIRHRSDAVPALLKERIISRLRKLAPEVQLDEGRIVQEAAIAADRADITEEIVRLEAHLRAFRDGLRQEQPGKRLDFLVQEIAREFNTIGSKAQHSEISHLVVSAKVELEKVREQLQNVE